MKALIGPLWFINLITIQERLDNGDYWRASGLVTCGICQKTFYEHPLYYDNQDFESMFKLTLLCDGSLVHL